MADRPALSPLPEGKIETYQGRGVFVSDGETAAQIMEGARVLERDYGVAPFISRAMVRAVLRVARHAGQAAATN